MNFSPKQWLLVLSYVSIILLLLFVNDTSVNSQMDELNRQCGNYHRIESSDVVFYIHDNRNIKKHKNAHNNNNSVHVFSYRKQLISLSTKLRYFITFVLICEFLSTAILSCKIYSPTFVASNVFLIALVNKDTQIRQFCFVFSFVMISIVLFVFDHLNLLNMLSACENTLFSIMTWVVFIFYIITTCVRIYYSTIHKKEDEILKSVLMPTVMKKKFKQNHEKQATIDLPTNMDEESFKKKIQGLK
mgnify:CR=1 FL=1|tara:strand:+ start:300 stop:1034 length:735 start_codon:yes stop_codon:yes gene_type:complete